MRSIAIPAIWTGSWSTIRKRLQTRTTTPVRTGRGAIRTAEYRVLRFLKQEQQKRRFALPGNQPSEKKQNERLSRPAPGSLAVGCLHPVARMVRTGRPGHRVSSTSQPPSSVPIRLPALSPIQPATDHRPQTRRHAHGPPARTSELGLAKPGPCGLAAPHSAVPRCNGLHACTVLCSANPTPPVWPELFLV